jgi:hydroxymethylglutaryl-CoA lyase
LADAGVTLIMPSDTIGASDRQSITGVMGLLNRQFPHLTIGAHLHTTPNTWREKMEAAYGSGCRRFDSAIGGLGGCPIAKDDLTGNMPTERVVDFMLESGADTGLDANALKEAIMMAAVTFPVG